MRIALVLLAGTALAAATYFLVERLGRRAWGPFLCRAVAWSALGLLLVNVSCPLPGAQRRPLVLLDASLSMTAAGGRWTEARDSARAWGDVLPFGDEQPGGTDPAAAPSRGRSLLQPALTAAAAADRPVLVVSDGEVTDAADLPPAVLARTGVRLFPRVVRPGLAVTSVRGPARITAGDSLTVTAEVAAVGGAEADSAAVELRAGDRVLARRSAALEGGTARFALAARPDLPAGEHVLAVALAGPDDGEARDGVRLHHLQVAETPGVVLVAAPGDWDSRFLFAALRDVADLPVRGYVRLTESRWRTMGDLAPATEAQVRQAARQADLLVVKGSAAPAEGSRARGLWRWPSGEGGESVADGDWYVDAMPVSPLAGAFLGLPLDSFPPVERLTPMQPPGDAWVALTARESRRGAPRPVAFGRELANRREVTVAADGLWRWAFRGGAAEQVYRSWVAATVSWLLGGADSARGRARPVDRVVENGRPLVFEWLGPGQPAPLSIRWSGDTTLSDTLLFDGAGRAEVRLPPGSYRYALAGGGTGVVAVETWSPEWLPRPVLLQERPAVARAGAARTAARDWIWLFALCVAGLAGEWLLRRRLGLR